MTKVLFTLFPDVSVRAVPRSLLSIGSLRLDASFYDDDSQAAYAAMRINGLPSDLLSSISEVYRSNLRERVFVEPAYGIPLLTGSSLDVEEGENQKHISRTLTRNIADDTLQTGDILISGAGTVGKVDLVWKNHENKLGGEDLVRLRPKPNSIQSGYLYAFFSSPLGNAIFSHHASGSVIIRVYPEQIAGTPIPRIGVSIETQIHRLVAKSFDLRHESRGLLHQASLSAQQVNRLKLLRVANDDEPESFLIPARTLSSASSELRLEAHFYNPLARTAVTNIQECPSHWRTVGALSHDVIMGGRFKRNYVESAYGTPFLSGKNIIQIRPVDLKHLSNSETEGLNDMLVKRGWILVTCSGTVGRTSFVWHNFESYAASQHILRVLPNEDEVDPGYLYAFLSSEYGYEQIHRFRHGSVIDELTDEQLKNVIVPLPSPAKQKAIGDKVRQAYEKRSDALRLEDEAQEILMREIKGHNMEQQYV